LLEYEKLRFVLIDGQIAATKTRVPEPDKEIVEVACCSHRHFDTDRLA